VHYAVRGPHAALGKVFSGPGAIGSNMLGPLKVIFQN
jgi:hypothetical protein